MEHAGIVVDDLAAVGAIHPRSDPEGSLTPTI
jgi:hypothetical protein